MTVPDNIPLPVVPESITVHLGLPDQPAQNVTVPFAEYIKNVASGEIYPTWPEAAIRANVLAQITYALNRVYTEWYPSQGYDFDITSSTRVDQTFAPGRDIFENISRIVDETFNDYVVRRGSVEPYFTQYCNGTTSTCAGLSQWGTVQLAESGLGPYEILQNYYGDDIDIVFDAPVGAAGPSYPGTPLKLGDAGEDVRTVQRQLTRIARNYPAIPPVGPADGYFTPATQAAVVKFQQIFNLADDGIVGKATWYELRRIYNTVKRLGELAGEGLTIPEVERAYARLLQEGDRGVDVRTVQYYLAVIGFFDDALPVIATDGIFGTKTAQAVRTLQAEQGLPITGIVDRPTWDAIRRRYDGVVAALPPEYAYAREDLYPGIILSSGMEGEDIRRLQRFLAEAARRQGWPATVTETGVFDAQTADAVRLVQRQLGLNETGVVGPVVWARIVQLARGTGEDP
ncbi:MAG: peptidoglycan-binding protein [Christensenellaceae bacterium]|nr:peptidoglycan-binding protein [Christensenellaceae bacterium]